MNKKIVLDLETQKDFAEVGGRQNFKDLKVSYVGIYRYDLGSYEGYFEAELGRLGRVLSECQLLIGFNIRGFDLNVIAPYLTIDVKRIPVLDLMDSVVEQLGFRISLNDLAKVTLGKEKSGTGMDALKYFREGRLEELAKYCLRDVEITKELYEYGVREGQIKYPRYGGSEAILPVKWKEVKGGSSLVEQGIVTSSDQLKIF
ncbi:MAG: helicase [Parcubacteria group bacterium]|nr:helicase [Parcubacteria group bacterium]